LSSLASVSFEQHKYAEAESLLRKRLTGQEKYGANTWRRYDNQSMLGASLAAQSRFAEAEPLLLAGYKGLLQSSAAIPWEDRATLERAGERVVQLYVEWGRPEKADEWRGQVYSAHSAVRPR
jgi:hypothetical protein